MSEVKIAAIIPARMASSRYAGKPLIDIGGIPMVEHVRRRTVFSGGFSEVVVATCDLEIYDAVTLHGGTAIMTSSLHEAASDRVKEASEKIDCTHVVNVQGDELLILPQDLSLMIAEIKKDPSLMAWNAIADIDSYEELVDHSIVKCVISRSNKVMYCARDFTHLKVNNGFQPVRKILGILGFSKKGLNIFGELERTPIEINSSIDQSRLLEHDFVINGVSFESGYLGVNEKYELEKALTILENDKTQKAVLKKIIEWNN